MSLPSSPADFLASHTQQIQILDIPEEDRNCAICLEPYGEDSGEYPIRISGCSHIFGNICLTAHVNSGGEPARKCPMDRELLWASVNDLRNNANSVTYNNHHIRVQILLEMMANDPDTPSDDDDAPESDSASFTSDDSLAPLDRREFARNETIRDAVIDFEISRSMAAMTRIVVIQTQDVVREARQRHQQAPSAATLEQLQRVQEELYDLIRTLLDRRNDVFAALQPIREHAIANDRVQQLEALLTRVRQGESFSRVCIEMGMFS